MAKSVQKERENRSSVKRDLTFHPYTVTLENVNTSLLLLKSSEPEILCQTLHALTKFAAQDLANREVLFDRDAIAYVLPHTLHNEFNVRRFALKLLAQLCQLPSGPEKVLKDPVNVKNLATIYVKIEDIFVLEFVSLVLAELTREPLGCEQVISANILDNIFNRIKNSVDPDVQKNSLQILSNLLDDPMCASEVTKSPRFSWGPLLLMLQNKYVAIQQTSLQIIDKLLGRCEDQAVQKSFRATTGIQDFCDIIESYEFRDLHTMVLNVLRTYAATEENALFMHVKGCTVRLLLYFERTIPDNQPACLAVLSRMSLTANGRDALIQTNTDKLFCLLLSSTKTALWADAALGVANMAQLMPSAVGMADTTVVDSLCAIAVNESVDWFNTKLNALRALGALCRLIPKAAADAVRPSNFGCLRSVNKRYKDIPIEAQRASMQCYKNLLNHEVAQNVMLCPDFLEEIISVLYRPDVMLKILACDVLAGLMHLEGGRELFTELNGENAVSAGLRFKHVGLTTAFCNLIIASASPIGADLYLRLGTIDYMIQEKQARYSVGAWEPALEAVFRCHASAKFAYTGYLDINDYTQDGFYVQKRLVKTLPPLRELLERRGPPRGPVYVANFHTVPHSQSQVVVQNDENLRSYILRLRLRVDDQSASTETSSTGWNVDYNLQNSTREKAQILGEFVAEQMSGLTRDRDCSASAVDLHVSKLMGELNSEVISIGHLRVGGPLERAILYKTLADRIALPCALRRACGAIAWCEVAIPEPEPVPVTDGAELPIANKEGVFPSTFLRANYVVDLMERPGSMYKAGSHRAAVICGSAYPRPYTAKTVTNDVYID